MTQPDQPAGPYSIGSEIWPGLSKLVEECGEVLEVAGKLIATGGEVRHWGRNTSLAQLLQDEIADVMAACHFIVEVNPEHLDIDEVYRRVHDKVTKFRGWHQQQS